MRSIHFAVLFIIIILAVGPVSAKTKRGTSTLDTSVCDLSNMELDDGDSFSCDGEQVRVLGIDTPEIKHPQHGITRDQPYGRKAAALTKKLLKSAKRVVIVRAGRDPYGRTLAHVLIDGELLGVKLIKAGLAYETVGRYGDNGMPEFALAILEASRVSPMHKFEDPYLWRKKNQKRDSN